ncbi:inulinase [Magnaporthiopsis poae ATCC 64411]|uniref:Inulinase n=1 Tax=Magnaporthiopsis poae (strain ATCC 64411 / 73-15) TaxID=644358 RepID=A0A0C4E8C6_MAGP6|nr:inulinase [Magnaporthiopsis poae ATCC 64411]
MPSLRDIAAFAVRFAAASSALSVHDNASTSTDSALQPVAGNYTGALRPQVHFSAPQNFMNDPNGLFLDAKGVWHAYYQYNPTELWAGNQHWGHATSRDLYHWENQPIAIFPPEDRTYVFSGSVVTDPNNTSGFFPGRDDGVIAMFTLARSNADGTAGPQTQSIAYSLDGGYSFRHYDGNPVINSTSSQFRDPKVIWHHDRWVMVLAYAQEFTVGIYTSPNMREWTHASNFSRHGLLGAQWECPNLVKMPVRDAVGGRAVGEAYVMVVSVQPGAPLGGSATQYFPGDFNGTHFTPWDGATRLAEFAKDNYAAQYFYGVPEGENAVSMSWASNWQYANTVPTGQLEGWRGGLTLPRENYLARAERVGWVMVNEVHAGFAPLLPGGGTAELGSFDFDGSGAASKMMDLGGWNSGSYYIDTNVTGLEAAKLGPDAYITFSLSSPSTGERLRWGFVFTGDTPFWIDRGEARALFQDNVFFTDKFAASDVWNTTAGAPAWRVQAVADRSILEVFVDSGVHAATALYFPAQPLSVLHVQVGGLSPNAKVRVAVMGLEGVWNK